MQLQYTEPDDADFLHTEIIATPVGSAGEPVLLRIPKGSSNKQIVMQGLKENTKYEIHIVAVDQAGNKSSPVTQQVDIEKDTTPPTSDGAAITVTKPTETEGEQLVFKWESPTDKSISTIKISLKDSEGKEVKTKEVAAGTHTHTMDLTDSSGSPLPKEKEYTVEITYIDNNNQAVKSKEGRKITIGSPLATVKPVAELTVEVSTAEVLTIQWKSPVPSATVHVILDIQEKNGNKVGRIDTDGSVIPFTLKGTTSGNEVVIGEDTTKDRAQQTLTLTAATYGIVGAKAYTITAKVYDTITKAYSETKTTQSDPMTDTVVSTGLEASTVRVSSTEGTLLVRWAVPSIVPTAIHAYLEVLGKSTEEAKQLASRELSDFGGVALTLYKQEEGGTSTELETKRIAKGSATHTFTGLTAGNTYTVTLLVYDKNENIGTKSVAKTITVSGEINKAPQVPTAPALVAKSDGSVEVHWKLDERDKDIATIEITPTVNDKEQQAVEVEVKVAADTVSHRLGPYKHGATVQFSVKAVDTEDQKSAALTIPSEGPHTIDAQAPKAQTPIVAPGKASVHIKSDTTTSTGFTVAWTAPDSFGKNAEGVDVVASKVQYRVYYTEKQGSTPYTAQTILDDDTHTTSDPVAGTTNPLQVAINNLKPDTPYAVMVATHHADSPTTASYSAVVELRTSKATMEGTLAYNAIEVFREDSGTVSTTEGGISTLGVRYAIEKKTGHHTEVNIDETTGIVRVPKNLVLGESEHTITASKEGYESKTAVLKVTIIMDMPLASITHKTLTDKRTYTFTVNWENGEIQGKKEGGSPLDANEIPYEIHYAWEKKEDALARTRVITIADIQGMGTHTTHAIGAKSTLPTTATVTKYMGADQRVYVYVKAINGTDDTKHTISAMQYYDTAIAYTQIAAGGGLQR